MLTFDINHLAAIVAGVVAFFIGALWYTALFGSRYEQLQGYDEETKKELEKRFPRTMVTLAICYVVTALVLAVLAASLGATTAAQGALLGLVVWLGFAATIGLTSNATSDRPFGVYLIDAGYQLVFLVVVGVIVAVWR